MTLMDRLDWLCNLQPGTVWTEYHWREALQIRLEVERLMGVDDAGKEGI